MSAMVITGVNMIVKTHKDRSPVYALMVIN